MPTPHPVELGVPPSPGSSLAPPSGEVDYLAAASSRPPPDAPVLLLLLLGHRRVLGNGERARKMAAANAPACY